MATLSAAEAILTAALFIDTSAWTSDDIAAHMGTSQSAVARAWRQAYGSTDLVTGLPGTGLWTLESALVTTGGSALAFRPCKGRAGAATSSMRSPRRPAVQALLAGDIVARQGAPAAPHDTHAVAQFVQSVGEGDVVLTCLDERQIDSGDHLTVRVERDLWQALLCDLVARTSDSGRDAMTDAHDAVKRWARSGDPTFSWSASRHRTSVPQATSATLKSSGQVVADQVLEHIVSGVEAGRLRAGDRLFESGVARALHTTRNQTRDALRLLASSGLVTFHATRGFQVPAPTPADVVDVYSARSALGSTVVRRAAQQPHEVLSPAVRQLEVIADLAAAGEVHEAGWADLAFQDALATCSGMRNVPQMMHALSSQLRVYIALMGVGYDYPIPDILRDNRAIMAAIHRNDADTAVAAWNSKMRDAHSYMAARL